VNEKIEFKRRRSRIPANRTVSGVTLGLAMLAVALIALYRLSGLPSMGPRDTQAAVQSSSDLNARRTTIVEAAAKASPGVVHIGVVTTRIISRSPLSDQFFNDFFRGFVPPSQLYKYKETIPDIGSGVIVSPEGYVVTNAHVVHGAEQITVVLPDGRSFPGKLAGVHEPSDIAIVKINGKDIPYVQMGDSDTLMVGEWAIAIGNPFGNLIEDTRPSVTLGVISARTRSFKPEGTEGRIYADMIQTDAAINPGNSGGALVDADGEVIGINTFIFTTTGGSMGVGFAIPINRAKKILEEVRKYGKVRNVWIGFTVSTVDQETAHALGLPVGGVVIRSVEQGSPADQAGMKPGDVIVRIDNRRINNADDVVSALGAALADETFSIELLRKGKEMKTTLTTREAP
jgi:serine protease Do